jgi:hypothetical protein
MSGSEMPQRHRHNPTRTVVRNTEAYMRSLFLASQRYGKILASLINDQGGADRLPEVRLQLLRRFAAYALIAEQMEARLTRGDEINVNDHALVCNMLVRIAQSIGLDRTSHGAAPTLADYLRSE